MTRHWLAVASADHVRQGRAGGFMQVCHGKVAPLRRIHPGDGVVHYSPTEQFGGGQAFRAFTAIGVVADGEPYPFEMEEGFCPFRRDVRWLQANEAPIGPLLGGLDFTAGKRNWGYQLRFGLCAISAADWQRIARAMGAETGMQWPEAT